MMAFRVGEVVPVERGRGIWREDWPPAWFIFTTPAQSESAAAAWLQAQGVCECWFPVEVRWRRQPHGRRAKVKYSAPIVPRYIFAFLPAEPHWDVLFDRARGKLSGVVSRDGLPLAIPEAAILQMRHVPERLALIRERDRIARIVRPGDRASVTTGPLAGWTVDVESIHGGIARIVVPLLGRSSVEISVANLARILPVAS